jgi:hypothetical protein
MANIDVQERNDVTPLCPHCGAPIKELAARQLGGFIGKRYVYFCSMCHKVLGVSHRKGLLAG